MNRIDSRMKDLGASKKKMLSPYITAGDPSPDLTVELMHALVNAGADILEIGIPFSDPMAEGPVIQAAMERALRHKVNCSTVLAMVKQFRQNDSSTPVVLMGYMNPIEQYGHELFAKEAHEVGVDGMIIVDLPPEEGERIHAYWQEVGLYPIYLCSPTTSDQRLQLLNDKARGYLYYVALKGVTGAEGFDVNAVKAVYLQRKSQTNLPLMVGFGIKTPEMAAKVAEFADGVIVGAASIEAVQNAFVDKKDVIKAGASLIHEMRLAIDRKR